MSAERSHLRHARVLIVYSAMLCYGQLAPPLTLSCLFRFQGKRESGKVVESDDNGIQFMGENTSNPSEAVKAGNVPKARKQPGPSKAATDAPAQPAAAPYLILDLFDRP
jgi:hypothetical protein